MTGHMTRSHSHTADRSGVTTKGEIRRRHPENQHQKGHAPGAEALEPWYLSWLLVGRIHPHPETAPLTQELTAVSAKVFTLQTFKILTACANS